MKVSPFFFFFLRYVRTFHEKKGKGGKEKNTSVRRSEIEEFVETLQAVRRESLREERAELLQFRDKNARHQPW